MPKDLLYQGAVFVKKSPIHGYGVFAGKDFAEGEVIEECHTLFTSHRDPDFSNYYFIAEDKAAIPLGHGCIYNHSNTPNIHYAYDPDNGLIIFTAAQAITAGEELCSSYGDSWFASRHLKDKTATAWRRACRHLFGLPLRAVLISGGLLLLLHGLKYLSS